MRLSGILAVIAIAGAAVAALPAEAHGRDGWRGHPGRGWGPPPRHYARPRYYAPPVVYAPRPYYYAPPRVVYAPPVYVPPPPVYYAPPPVYYGPPGVSLNFRF